MRRNSTWVGGNQRGTSVNGGGTSNGGGGDCNGSETDEREHFALEIKRLLWLQKWAI
jgi:hypothetical protein